MTSFDQSKLSNLLLGALPPRVFDLLLPHMVAVDLPVRHVLVEAGEPTSAVYFIERGLGSMVAVSADNESVEVGHIGREGMTGLHVLLGTDRTSIRTFMQVAGAGIEVSVRTFIDVLDQEPATRDFFLRYVHSCEQQLAHSALANSRYHMHERLAR